VPEPLEPPGPPNEPAYEEIVNLALRHAKGRRGGDLVSVLLVGSGARRAVTTHSDVDLVVLVKGQADAHEIVRVVDRTADIRYWGHKEVEEELSFSARLPLLRRHASFTTTTRSARSSLNAPPTVFVRDLRPPT
jgi:predicted nucleotidyltransferase